MGERSLEEMTTAAVVAEAKQRLALLQSEELALAQLLQERSDGLLAMAMAHAQRLALEQQESASRHVVSEEESAAVVSLAVFVPSVAGRMAELQADVRASQAQQELLQEALEERDAALAQLGRDLEALQDAEVASGLTAEVRQLERAEGERRASLVAAQRAAHGALQEIERSSRAAAAQHSLDQLVQSEAHVRRRIAEECTSGLDLGSIVQQLQALVASRDAELTALETELSTMQPGRTEQIRLSSGR